MRYRAVGALVAVLVAGFTVYVWPWRAGSGASGVTAPVLASDPPFMAIDGRNFDGKAKEAFTLINRGDSPVTIRGVEVGCALCIQATNLAGKVLGPGESCPLGIETDPPAAGVDVHKVKVHSDSSGSPLTLTVEVVGRGKVPYVLSTTPARVTFFDLDSVRRTETIRVETCEQTGSPPWLGPLTSDVRELEILGGETESHPHGPITRRSYEYKVGWRELPRSREFFGTIYATPLVPRPVKSGSAC